MRILPVLLLLVGLSLLREGRPQYFESGQDPASVKWYQINSENFQILFPLPFDNEAQRLANVLELTYQYATRSLNHKPKKITVVLHNYSSIGNAFVAWAPRRTEFYTIPPQDIYPQDWLDQLALHEYRHVIQISKMKQGITGLLYYILGEQIIAGIYGLYVPFWFTEGDAVISETALSTSGRGRLPAFEMEVRTQVVQRRIYPYEKAIFGSYKDYVPDRYSLGYLLTANGRKRYGAGIWDKALNYVARNPYHPFAFSRGIKRSSGLNKWEYYKSTMKELDSLWSIQQASVRYSEFNKINNTTKKVYTNYRFPQWYNDSLLIAQKSGLGDIEQFMLLTPDGKEKKVFVPGFYSPVWLSVHKNRIAWSEYDFDKRWENRRYYDIYTYDLEARKRKRITRKRFLFAPSLSPDGSQLAAVEVTSENHYSVAILNATTGENDATIPSPGNDFILTPTWSEDGSWLIAVRLANEGKSIVKIDPDSGTFENLLPYSFKDVTQPVQHGKYVYFHGVYSGIDNIYALHIDSKEVFQVTSSKYGAFDPSISSDGTRLAYADYSAMGFDIATVTIDTTTWIPLGEVKDSSIKLYKVLSAQEGGAVNFDTISEEKFPVKKYRKFTHLLNVHSWSPFYFDVNDLRAISPGFTVYSQNKLSTMIATAGYRYDYNERNGRLTAGISYQAWYPVIGLSFNTSRRTSVFRDTSGTARDYNWKEDNFVLGISQPLNLTNGKYISRVTPAISVHYRNIRDTIDVPSGFTELKTFYTTYDFFAYRLLKTSPRDMRSRWGQRFNVNYKESPYGDRRRRTMLSLDLGFYFPGISKHHSLLASAAAQYQGRGAFNFSSPIFYARGYYGGFAHREFYRISADYKFPLLYPDLRIGPVLYMQRMKVNLFTDYAIGMNSTADYYYNSVGADVTFDVHLVNFIIPYDLGFRYVYRPRDGVSNVEFLFSIEIGSL